MIYLTKPKLGLEEIKKVIETFESGWVAGQGPMSNKLSEELSKKYGFKYVIPLNNCTAALHLALLSLGIKEGDDVLVSDYTFPATGHAVLYVKANPIFVDVDKETFNFDINDARKKITKKTKALICVHSFGNPCNMDEIMDFAKEFNLKVIEDAACALGSSYKDTYIGNFGDAAAFSFHARKNVTSGEGGFLVLKDKEAYEKARSLSCFGMKSAYDRQKESKFNIPEFCELGYNYKLSDINSAVALAQLDKYDSILKRRYKQVDYYLDLIKEYNLEDKLKIQKQFLKAKSVFQTLVFLTPNLKIRNDLIIFLKENNIQSNIGTYSSFIQPVYEYNKKYENYNTFCINSKEVYERSIALPLYYDLSFDEIELVVKKIKEFFNNIEMN